MCLHCQDASAYGRALRFAVYKTRADVVCSTEKQYLGRSSLEILQDIFIRGRHSCKFLGKTLITRMWENVWTAGIKDMAAGIMIL